MTQEAADNSPRELRWHTTIMEMIDVVCSAFRHRGKSQQQAEQDAQVAVEALYESYRGGQLYFPSSAATRTAALHERIYADFNGHNQAELSRKYRLSVQAVYRIIKKQRELKRSQQVKQND